MFFRIGKLNILFCFFFFSFLSKAQLVINEVSQGPSGAKEYVELVVVGSPTCTTIPCVDLRGYYLDDNNGTFASGTGVGIASGCIRFTTNTLWSCVPAGTIIVIYNDADVNANLPAQDLSITDGNCRLIISGDNSTLLERNTSAPSTTSTSYPTTGFGTGSNWASTVAMANGGDSFQTRDPAGNLISAVSWGNNSTSTLIYFAGSQTGSVCNNLNLANTNPLNQANWATAAVAGNETPGLPNNTANAAWINTMNFSCGTLIPTALTASISSAGAGCTCTGSATVTASGATAPYTYAWLPSGGNGSMAGSLCAGNYSLTTTSANGCVQTLTVNIDAAPLLTASITSTGVSCNGSGNGSATVSISGGTAPYTYTWSPAGGNSTTAAGLSAGDYSVTLTDANNCTATATTNISQPPIISLSLTTNNVSCYGGNNGSASVIASGGTGPYNYTWSPIGGNNTIANNLIQGTYTVTVTDNNLCIKDSQIIITQAPPLSMSLTSTAETCGLKNGTANAAASGGTGTFQYNWFPSVGHTGTALNLQAGIYTVTVTDSLLCSVSDTIRVQGFLAPVLSASSTPVLCNGGNTGTATSSISGGTAGYTYTWLPTGGNNLSATGLSAGNYTLFISDANGCKDTAYTTITEPVAITATLTSLPATCGNLNGIITSTVSGGTTAYTYTWLPAGGNNSTATNLTSGNYTLTVKDANSCSFSKSINVGNKVSPILSNTSSPATCFGTSTGNATVNIQTGTGTAPFTYSWLPGGESSPTLTNLAAGTYTVVVVDSANCIASQTVSITQPTAINLNALSTAATCGNANGSATCTATGGSPAYTYTWLPGGGTNSITNNLATGTYTVLVADANLCTTVTSVFVNSTSSLTMAINTIQNVSCNGNADGAISVNTNGSANATYTWQPAGGNSPSAVNLPAGISGTTYTLYADDNGCTDSIAATITEPPALSLTINDLSICSGQTGLLTTNVSGGNNTALSYTWSPTISTSYTANVNPTQTTSYTVFAQNTGCTSISQAIANVSVSPPVIVTVSSGDSICSGNQATLTATASGGTDETYIYSWSPTGASTQTITVSPTTDMVYTVSAYHTGCATATATTQVAIYPSPDLNINATPTSGCIFVCISYSASATGSGANSITSYSWDFGDGNNSLANNNTTGHCYMNAGNYNVSLTVISKNNCMETLTKPNFVHVYPKPVADFSASAFEAGIDNAAITFYDQSTSNIISWNWFIDNTTTTIQNPTHSFTEEGIYPVKLIVTNSTGCKDTVVKDIIINPGYAFYAPNCITPNGDGRNEVFLPEGTGWDNGTFNLWIFDRWGNTILHTTNPDQGWDGRKHNEIVQEDVYIWKVNLFDVSGKPHEYNGQVSVIR